MGNENTQFKELTGGSITYYKPSQMNKGDEFVGKYIESKIVGQYDSLAHFFERPETGERYAINNTGQLKHWMEQIEPGSLVKLVYDGTSQLNKGKFKGKDAHNFKISVAPAGASSPSAAKAASAAGTAPAANTASDLSDDEIL